MENKNTNSFDSTDILAQIETQQNTIDILQSIENTQDVFEVSHDLPLEIPEKKTYIQTILGHMTFLVKYIATSSFIFVVLLGTTNYSAYIDIARSYINPEALEVTQNGMYSSIQSTTLIKQQEEEKEVQESISNEQKLEMVKNRNYHSMEKLNHIQAGKDIALNIDITPYENRIVIPKIGKNIPLVEVENKTVQNVKELESVFMKELENGVVRYPGSARPGQEGNAFVFGHSSNFPWMKGDYNDVFALLDNVIFGDEVIAYYDQKKYVYKITQKKVIKPGDTTVLEKVEGKKQISLMTCWPVGTTLNRMIITGELVEEK